MSEDDTKPVRRFLRRVRPLAMPLAYTVFTLAVFWRLWTPIDGAEASWRYDPRYEYWGDLVFQFQTLADGHLALWNPFDRGGFPVYGDPQPGMLYPPNWLFSLWGAIAGGVAYAAISWKIVLHWIFGVIGMHLFVRRLGAPEQGCYVAGILFGWTAPKIRFMGSALNWSLAWIPWVLLALHWFAEKPSWRRGVVLGSTGAMVLLAGAPAVVLYTLLLVVPYGLYVLWGRLRAALVPLAVATGVAVAWLAPLLASNLAQLPETVRETRDVAFITGSTFEPGHVLSFLVPRIGGEPAYYGLFALLCAGAIVASGRRRALVFLGIAVAGVVLAFGKHTGVFAAAASFLKPFGFFREANRYLYVTATALGVLAALGFGRMLTLEDEDERRALARRLVWVAGAVTFVVGAAYLVSYVVSDKVASDKNHSLGLALLSCVAATWLVRAILVSEGKTRAIYAWIAVAVVALEVWTANARLLDQGFTPPPKIERDDTVASLMKVADIATEWRVYDVEYLDFRAGTRLGIRDFSGYEGDPLGLSRYKTVLAGAKKNVTLLGHANVRYYLDGRGRPPTRPSEDGPLRPVTVGGEELPRVYEVAAVTPAVFYVPDPAVVDSPEAGVAALRKITPGEGAVVEGAPPPAAPPGTPTATGRITTYEPNHVVAEIDAPGPGLVIVSEAYFPAWRATVNGDAVDIQPANVMFRGIPIPAAGHYEIDMRVRPLRFWGLLPLYLGAFGLLVFVVAEPRVRRWRSSRADREGDDDGGAHGETSE